MNNKKSIAGKTKTIFDQKYQIIISICLSSVMIICLLVHLFFPTLSIDNIALYIIGIAVLPWFIPLFRSIKLPGGFELEPSLLPIEEKERISDDAEKAGLFDKSKGAGASESKYHQIAKTDVKLALASLRIDIEEKLKNIAYNNNLSISNRGLLYMMRELRMRDLITNNEFSVISDIAGLLNKAVHSEIIDYDYSSTEWALDLGYNIILSLNRKGN